VQSKVIVGLYDRQYRPIVLGRYGSLAARSGFRCQLRILGFQLKQASNGRTANLESAGHLALVTTSLYRLHYSFSKVL
jgi:hypothetical protein